MASYIDYLESLSKKQLMVMLARQRHEETHPLAIIGMGCRFPDGVDDPEAFWTLLHEGRAVSMTSEHGPADSLGRPRWNLAAPDLAPIAALLRVGAYLREVDRFDAEYFGVSEQEALHMDPQQRLLLEVTVQALADANLTRTGMHGRRVGIFIGTSPVEYPYAWLRNRLPAEQISPFMGTGSTPSAAAGRIGLMLGVSGPAMNVDSASSSVLVALHLAGMSLRRRECDLAIIGACNLLLSPFATAILASAGMLSKSGRSQPFGAQADGHVRGEGCGIFVLKRHQDALADGDLPYALVRGSSIHQHGDRLGLAVASASGQKTVIDQALRAAGIGPLDVQYVEAQANGSRLGGVVEAEAISHAFARQTPGAPPLYVGSCKANLGYLETASGAPGLMKTVLALAHAEIPPQLGADHLDPTVAWERIALRFARAPTPWPVAEPRVAGVSAFGFTGTNAHVIVESASPRPEPEPEFESAALLVVSAHNEAALAATAQRLHRKLESCDDWTFATVCRTLAQGRDLLKVRRAVVVRDRATVLEELATLARGGHATTAVLPRRGLAVAWPTFDESFEGGALRAGRAPGFEALWARVVRSAEAMKLDPGTFTGGEQPVPAGAALAWSMGWIDLIAALGLEIVVATFAGRYAGALGALVVGRSTSEHVCSQWANAEFDPDAELPELPAGWELQRLEGGYVVRRPGRVAAPLAPAAADPAGWLAAVAEQIEAGVDVQLSALGNGRRCRLPGPAFTGKSYWPAHNRWS